MYIFLFAGQPVPVMNKGVFWGGLCCYLLAFLLVLNYAFDFSSPVVAPYLLAKKYYSTSLSDDEGGPGGDRYYFDLIHPDSMATPASWVAVSQQTYYQYRDSWQYKKISIGMEEFILMDKKQTSAFNRQYYFLLLKIIGSSYEKEMTEREYARFEKGDTFYVEQHNGLLGVKWLTYR
ncbi:hypothetical protein [Chitinophaga nivalis]|uniref:Uncharacterized protein n=1 Tax=Chitinophaga nivalis TaxID=2991709 RepID=A0ABT3IES8_9BACT|nr:hypothetical protein [Chitinophaga nivalis]MCW3467844.1 hypothetical protein [Chitinophaga nivalis]MCW3482464.1 hypothetical protein [Chitinophaga nivalis]